MKLRITAFFILMCQLAFSQGISGLISDSDGKPIPYTNVYVPQLNRGTTSNADGLFELRLPEGTWAVEFRNISYNTVAKTVQVTDQTIDLPVRMDIRTYRIGEIRVTASGEDPAWYVMRRAIAMAPYYRNQVSESHYSVYLRGSAVFRKIPKLVKKQFEKEGLKLNTAYSLESQSRVDFQLPDKVSQKVVAQRTSGMNNGSDPMPMIMSNLYNSSGYGAISPFDKLALKVYDFKLVGMFGDQGRMVNRIQVTPKRKGNDLFTGEINITEGFWSLHSADLTIEQPMAKIRMKQIYGPVGNEVWMPVSFNFNVDVKVFGVDLGYSYVSSISDYQVKLNPELDHSYLKRQQSIQVAENEPFRKSEPEKLPIETNKQAKSNRNSAAIDSLIQKDELTMRDAIRLQRLMEKETKKDQPKPEPEIKELVTFDEHARELDSLAWETLRPIPLTPAELTGFHRGDSLLKVRSTKAYKDSVAASRTRFKVKHLVFGKPYQYQPVRSEALNSLSVPGILGMDGITFNTVDGLRINYPISWFKRDTLGHLFSLSSVAGYAFAREKLDASLGMHWMYNGRKRSSLSMSAGSVTSDFNQESGMSPALNTYYSLFLEKNYKKFYRNDFVRIGYQTDLTNGLVISASFSWSNRLPLENNSGFRFRDVFGREYSPNIPGNESPYWANSGQSYISMFLLKLNWTPGQRYSIRNGFKYPRESRFPTFTMTCKKAVPGLFGGDADYDFLEFGLTQKVRVNNYSILEYRLNSGAFMNQNRKYFADYKHFATDYTGFYTGGGTDHFKLLPFYVTSSSGGFIEAHLVYDSGRLLLKRLPFLAKTMLREQLSVHFLTNENFSYYTEIGYGVKQIFGIMSLEAVAGFEELKFRSAGIKLGMALPGTN